MRKQRLAACLLALGLTLGPAAACSPAPAPVSDNYRNYYEIFVRSFYDSDGDGLGDLAGVTAKLDYIHQDLGADGIWLMPIMPSPTYHKYDVTNYYDIDPEYGTQADFDALVAAADQRDIKVIIDLVLNHTSNRHPWFDTAVDALWTGQDSPYIDYYHFTEDNPGEGYSKITDRHYYECRFTTGMPDLNLDNEDVRAEIVNIVRFWLDRGVDGFRLDACTSYYTGNTGLNVAFLEWLNQEVKAINPQAYLVGEVWSDSGTITDYYASGIDSFFNFPYAQATGKLVLTINNQTGRDFATGLTAWNTKISSQNESAIDAPFLSNHDIARSAGFLLRNLQKEKMAAAIYLLMPGNPFIYYGEELGMNGSGIDENKRLPMLWSLTDTTGMTYKPSGATQTVEGIVGADEQIKDEQSLLNFYKQILAVKAKIPTIARGDLTAVDTGFADVAALQITWNEQTAFVVHNLATEPRTLDLTAFGDRIPKLSEYLSSLDSSEKPVINGSQLTLPPLSTTVLQ